MENILKNKMIKRVVMLLVGISVGILLILLLANRFGWGSGNRMDAGEVKRVVNQDSMSEKDESDGLEIVDWKLEEVASDMFVPWSIVFTSDERMLVSERSGYIREVIRGELKSEPLIELKVSSQAEEGLMGMVLDPKYHENKYIYACYAYELNGDLKDKVIRMIDGEIKLVMDEVIVDEIPAAKFHAGCRLGIGPDEKLYITTGDATSKESAQDLSSLAGKILRVNLDGSIPEDNPFPGSPIFSYGHRNPQGIDWHPDTSKLYSSEHGPSVIDGPAGGDEINQIKQGGNYGWPLVSHDQAREGMESPLIQFTPAEAPGSLMIYSGQVFGQYRHNLFFGALKGTGLVRVSLAADGTGINQVEKLDIDVGRVREVMEGPDGYIYFTTSNRDGRGDLSPGDDKVYRLIPKVS